MHVALNSGGKYVVNGFTLYILMNTTSPAPCSQMCMHVHSNPSGPTLNIGGGGDGRYVYNNSLLLLMPGRCARDHAPEIDWQQRPMSATY